MKLKLFIKQMHEWGYDCVSEITAKKPKTRRYKFFSKENYENPIIYLYKIKTKNDSAYEWFFFMRGIEYKDKSVISLYKTIKKHLVRYGKIQTEYF